MDNLYNNNTFGSDSDPADNDNVMSEIKKLKQEIKKLQKKLKKARNSGKKGKVRKHKGRIENLEAQHEHLLRFVQITAKQQKPQWWQQALVNAAPKLIDVALQNIFRPRNHEGNGKK